METALNLAGIVVPDAFEHVARYCGLREPTGDAGLVYDTVASTTDGVDATDIAALAGLGVRLESRMVAELFAASGAIAAVCATLPRSLSLDDEAVDLTVVGSALDAVRVAADLGNVPDPILAKILHRKRPRLFPPFDRSTENFYGRQASSRDQGRWPKFVPRLVADLRLNKGALVAWQIQLATETDGTVTMSRLRLLDLVIWAEQHRKP